MKISKQLIYIFFTFSVISCGTKKVASESRAAENDATANFVVEKHYEEEVQFETMRAELEAKYEDESQSHRLSVSLRMDKEDTIWLSGSMLGFPVAKIMITPEKVFYYEKLSRSYFEGDFDLLSDWLGVPLNFQKVQNLLLGQALFDLRKEAYLASAADKAYKMEPAKNNLLKRLFLISATNFKVLSEQISQTNAAKSLTVHYPQYQEVEGKVIPDKIKIIANEPSGSAHIEIDFDDVEFNTPVEFPFSIPSGYDEISIE